MWNKVIHTSFCLAKREEIEIDLYLIISAERNFTWKGKQKKLKNFWVSEMA